MVTKAVRVNVARNEVGRYQRGFTYLGVLIAIAILGIGLQAASEVWVKTARHEKLEELNWTGKQFTQAIGSYYLSTPGGAWTYPLSLDDLLEDRRFATTRRHLRTIYANPFTGKADWELVMGSDGRLHGVRTTVPEGVFGEKGGTVRTFIYSQSGTS